MAAARVLVEDDHPAFLSVARQLLTSEGLDVVGTAANGLDAVIAATALHPDVVLLDIQLPDIDGFEVARRLLELEPPPAVVLTSSRDAEDYGPRLQHAAARGFIGKSELSGARIAALVNG